MQIKLTAAEKKQLWIFLAVAFGMPIVMSEKNLSAKDGPQFERTKKWSESIYSLQRSQEYLAAEQSNLAHAIRERLTLFPAA